MGKISWKKEFTKEVIARFAAGEGIEAIAEWAGCEQWEIEAVLKENAVAMQEAFNRVEALGGAKAGSGGTAGIAGALHRIAAAVERIAEAQEKGAKEMKEAVGGVRASVMAAFADGAMEGTRDAEK